MKALGITAMIFAIIAILVPIAGPYLTLVCALLAAFAAGPGLTFGIVAILLNLLNVIFLSPSLWLSAGMVSADQSNNSDAVLAGIGVIFVGAQVVALIILSIVHMLWKKSV